MFQCDKKDVGPVKSASVFELLPEAVFTLVQISVDDPRLDDAKHDDSGPGRRYVWALEMNQDEWDKLYASLFPGKGGGK